MKIDDPKTPYHDEDLEEDCQGENSEPVEDQLADPEVEQELERAK